MRRSCVGTQCDQKTSPPATGGAYARTRPTPQPVQAEFPRKRREGPPFIDILNNEQTNVGLAVTSDDDVPAPIPDTGSVDCTTGEVGREYEGLNSILCAYKMGAIEPGVGSMTHKVCAEVCSDEATAVSAWSREKVLRFHPMILSALKVVYPNKKVEWFSKPFLQSASSAAKY